MNSTFDPYFQWLGIPRDEQPVDHYRLLGLARFENDPERIEAAADERMSLVRQHQTGPRGVVTQPLLNELAAARNCLMSFETKRAYDDQLRRKVAAAAPLAKVVPRPPTANIEPPVAAPPLPDTRATTLGGGVEADGEVQQGSSAWSLIGTFLSVALAVVLVAGATYGIGRLVWFRPAEVARGPIEDSPAAETNPEANPEANPEGKPRGDPSVGMSRGPARTVVVMQEGSREVNLTPATAALSGGVRLQPTGGDELLDHWSRPGDEASWELKLLRPGYFQLEVTYAALDEAGETAMTALVDEKEVKTYSLRPTGDLTKWASQQHTVALTSSGQHTLALRLDGPVDMGTLVLKRVRLIPIETDSRLQK